MKIKHLLTCLLFLKATYSFAQQKTFTVDKNLNETIDLVSKFQSQLTNQEFDAVKGDDIFLTDIAINKEQYSLSSKDNFLILKYKNKPVKAIISSSWNIKLQGITGNKTTITLSLKKIDPDRTSKPQIDLTKTKSSGKLEAMLKNFIESNTDKEEYVLNTPGNNNALDVAQATNTNINLGVLLDKNKLIPLPVTVDYFTKRLGLEPKTAENELCEKGIYYIWDLENGVNFIYSRLKDKNQYASIAYFGDEKISGLPLGLTFNESTFEQCKYRFAKYKPSWQQETTEVSATESKAFLILEFKVNQYFVQLGFYNNKYVTSVQVSTKK
ncbi:hypothetical protein [Pedobacter nototheniae]|uniref:hypothetical protein n=1 Tax=Pedobacter nototheniae TaxID=2488994 RepID=UPI00293068B2|nr:hypothetical protein [Pedobacter nototheniae]